MQDIGDRIKQVRKAASLPQWKFAETLNVKQTTIAMIEINKRNATDRLIADICRVYGCSESWLRTGEGSMIKEENINEDIAAWVGRMLSCEDNFKKKFLVALSKLSEDDWKTVEKICRLVLEDDEKPQ